MRVMYDPEVDIMYIRFREGDVAESDEVKDGMIIDYDSMGRPLGLELLDASELFSGKPEVTVDFGLVHSKG
ncbi:MAG: DUF2283 domain-containing protein [Planctomycetota bacterium]|nr:DUF2283 domain-containing protein [Planctomycetota bacterium]